jgi:putative hydrolase of the HAD superfamily
MSLKALMVDVDGVIVVLPEGRHWWTDLEADLGLDPQLLRSKFFAPNFEDIVHGRADLHERLAPFLAEAAPLLTSAALCD